MLTYDMDNREGLSRYEYLYQCIKKDILEGRLAADEKLPSKRALAEHLKLAVITVENAYQQLLMEGYLYSQERKGFFVSPMIESVVTKPSHRAESKNSVENIQKDMQKTAIGKGKKHWIADFKNNYVNRNKFPYATWSKLMRRTLSINAPCLLEAVPFRGLRILREAIAAFLYQQRGMEVRPEQIVIGSGIEALYVQLFQMLANDTVYGMEDPGYQKTAKLIAKNGYECNYIPIDEKGLSVEHLKKTDTSVVILAPSHQFPTGLVMPISRRRELQQWASQKKNRYIIEDDYDSEFRYTGKLIPTIFSRDEQERVIYMNSFYKSLSPAIRICYMILPESLMRHYEKSMRCYSCSASTFEQYNLALFISEGYFERHINRMKKYYRNQRNILVEAIRRSPLADISTIYELNAGTHFILCLNTEVSDKEIAKKAKEQGINVSFLSDYCNGTVENREHLLILNYADIEDIDLDVVLQILKEVISQ